MKFRKITAIYSLLVALAMSGLLTILLISGRSILLPNQLQIGHASISAAALSDLLTAVALLVAAIAGLLRAAWADKAFLVGMGVLFYSVINAVGVYAQKGDLGFLAMFDVILLVGLALTILTLKELPSISRAIKVAGKEKN
jgi:hypothetical protein